jgi:hypothetical protein
LFKQKNDAYTQDNPINGTHRHLHNSICGQYAQGRHASKIGINDSRFQNLVHPGERQENLPIEKGLILWYGYSPWNDSFINRKMSMSDKIPDKEREKGYGAQHFWDREHLDRVYNEFKRYSENIDLASKYDFWT